MEGIFDRYYKKYDAWYERNTFAYLSELKAIKKVLPKKGKGLEIGVGTGRFASALGIRYGVDPSENMLGIARKRGIDAHLSYGERLPFEDSVFDYAVIIITICFVRNTLKVLIEARRVLKKEGRIILGIVDRDSFLGRFYQKKKSVFYKQAKFFSVGELTDLLKKTGFGRFSYYQTIYNLPEKIGSIQNPGKGFGKGGFVVVSAKKVH
ncbi:MAG: class I SAM-dependent methyltransferase [Candidatus Omnitrophota bacterium]